jgi:hypothetical protein
MDERTEVIGGCSICGWNTGEMYMIDNQIICNDCRSDYRIDNPDWEEIAEAFEAQWDLVTGR